MTAGHRRFISLSSLSSVISQTQTSFSSFCDYVDPENFISPAVFKGNTRFPTCSSNQSISLTQKPPVLNQPSGWYGTRVRNGSNWPGLLPDRSLRSISVPLRRRTHAIFWIQRKKENQQRLTKVKPLLTCAENHQQDF